VATPIRHIEIHQRKCVQFKEDKSCAYNVTLWSIRVTTTAIETQHSSVCIIAYLHAAAKNIEPLSAAMKTREWVPLHYCRTA
jgi:hypothetical protein